MKSKQCDSAYNRRLWSRLGWTRRCWRVWRENRQGVARHRGLRDRRHRLCEEGRSLGGVQRQYSGTLGRVDNCQVAVSLHLAGEQGSGMIGYRLFLPESWATDSERRTRAGVPDDISSATKGSLALAQLDAALAAGVRRHVVLADAGYGDSTEFREAITQRNLHYVVAVNGEPIVWPPGSNPQIPPKPRGMTGRPRASHRDDKHPPITLKLLVPTLRFSTVKWREGSRGWQSGRFAAVRVRTAHGHKKATAPGGEQWLLCQQTGNAKAPYKQWLFTLPSTTSIATLVRFAKLRWRIERDYQELKGELGLDHFEGRTWRGFHHHHATLCAVAHGFLALRRALSPRRRVRWTLPMVRSAMQQVLLRRIGTCPLCRRSVDAHAPPQGASCM